MSEKNLAGQIESVNMPRRKLLMGLSALPALSILSGSLLAGKALAAQAQGWPLWEVTGKSGKVYLTGETPPRPNAWSDARIENLLPGCAALWTETSHTLRSNTNDLVGRYGLDSGAPIGKRIAAADLARLEQAAALAKIPMDSMQQFRPWLAAFALEESYYSVMNLPEKGTVEKVLEARAEAAGITHSSEFPAVDDVFAFMGAMTPEEDVQYLRYTLDHILAGPQENERIYAAWARGDVAPAAAFVANMREQQPDLYKKHVAGRNRNWLPRFDAMLELSAPSMVVVGFYHLVGPDSLLAQLKAQGLSVRMV
jgi:uncharacterized protein YbaP (TraB family)